MGENGERLSVFSVAAFCVLRFAFWGAFFFPAFFSATSQRNKKEERERGERGERGGS
jgi:hypothetical protein